jgi:hypothetical protein
MFRLQSTLRFSANLHIRAAAAAAPRVVRQQQARCLSVMHVSATPPPMHDPDVAKYDPEVR